MSARNFIDKDFVFSVLVRIHDLNCKQESAKKNQILIKFHIFFLQIVITFTLFFCVLGRAILAGGILILRIISYYSARSKTRCHFRYACFSDYDTSVFIDVAIYQRVGHKRFVDCGKKTLLSCGSSNDPLQPILKPPNVIHIMVIHLFVSKIKMNINNFMICTTELFCLFPTYHATHVTVQAVNKATQSQPFPHRTPYERTC